MSASSTTLADLRDQAATTLLRLNSTAQDVEALLASRAGENSGLALASELAVISMTETVEIMSRLKAAG